MPGVYRKKMCPHCGKEHRGRGPFCCQACSNSHRTITPETRAKHSEIHKEYSKLHSTVANRTHENNRKRANGEYVLEEDDWYVLPPTNEEEDDGLVL